MENSHGIVSDILVSIPMRNRTHLELKTSACEALDILLGRTIFAASGTVARDSDGRILTVDMLERACRRTHGH